MLRALNCGGFRVESPVLSAGCSRFLILIFGDRCPLEIAIGVTSAISGWS
jgi:hypothetical protein